MDNPQLCIPFWAFQHNTSHFTSKCFSHSQKFPSTLITSCAGQLLFSQRKPCAREHAYWYTYWPILAPKNVYNVISGPCILMRIPDHSQARNHAYWCQVTRYVGRHACLYIFRPFLSLVYTPTIKTKTKTKQSKNPQKYADEHYPLFLKMYLVTLKLASAVRWAEN